MLEEADLRDGGVREADVVVRVWRGVGLLVVRRRVMVELVVVKGRTEISASANVAVSSFSASEDVLVNDVGLLQDLQVLVENVALVARRPLHEPLAVQLADFLAGDLG